MMNEFIITNIETKMDHDYVVSSMSSNQFLDPFDIHQSYQTGPSIKITLEPRYPDEKSMRKIHNIYQGGRTVSLQDTRYADYIEPFRGQFIEFMMDKHPEKILADPKSWDRLLGRTE